MTILGILLVAVHTTLVSWSRTATRQPPARLANISSLINRFSLRTVLLAKLLPNASPKPARLPEETAADDNDEVDSQILQNSDAEEQHQPPKSNEWLNVAKSLRDLWSSFYVIAYFVTVLALLLF